MRILSMSGFVPEHICDTERFIYFSGNREISFYCGYASDYVSRVLSDDSIDGAVYPRSCDSTRVISGYIRKSKKFTYQINVPSYNVPGAVEYYATSIKKYKEAIEQYYGVNLDPVDERISLINERNAKIRKMYEILSDLSYSDYLSQIHGILKQPLKEQIWNDNLGGCSASGKRVYIVGSFLSNIRLVEKMEKLGMNIVGDSLPESGRLVSALPVNRSGDIYSDIAHSILSAKTSPTQNCFDHILKSDLEEIRRKDVKGVIFVLQNYCEPYEYLYGVYAKALDAMGIQVLKLSLDSTEDDKGCELMIEAFADTLKG